ncbi:MAG: arabinose isomerase [Clostridia bacterium]|nr:arabinose isomerase [Clostridia bacterium]
MNEKPRLGVLALMLEGYEPLFPGITQAQTDYVRQVIAGLAKEADCVFPRIALNRRDIEEMTRQYNREELDGILIFLCSYSQGQYLVRAMQENRLPLALALIQPDETVGENFEEWELTVNQGIHGSQDNANCLMRAGISCVYFAGSRLNGELNRFVADFGAAARAARLMKRMRIGVIGKLPGMGDVITDDMAVYRHLGAEFIYDSVGAVQSRCAAVTEQAIAERIALERTIFEIDPTMRPGQHEEAVRMYLGIKQYLEDMGYDGYTLHFEECGADGRFTQLPLLAASSLMADGYGYAAEGDASAAMMVALMHCLCGEANFSEMYMMDLKREAILLCHAGEGNWKTCRQDRKPFLMNRVMAEGGLDNPPTPIFAPRPGKAAVMSLVHVDGTRFRLVCAKGEILDECGLKKIDMPYMFFRPSSGVRPCVTSWLENGGTHHETVVLGDHENRIRMLCKLLNIDYCPV